MKKKCEWCDKYRITETIKEYDNPLKDLAEGKEGVAIKVCKKCLNESLKN